MKRTIALLAVFFICLFSLSGQDTALVMKKIVYKKTGHQELSADMFFIRSGEPKKNNPAIAFFHGGGWVFGKPSEFHEACRRFARKGYVTFSFQYRLSINPDGSYPNASITPVESVMDARSAIRWLKEHADQLTIDPDKIIVGGQSAGGQLALSTALMDSVNEKTDNLSVSPVPRALLLFSGNVNTLEAWVDMLLGNRRNEIWSISPYHNLKGSMPPVIAFHGEDDCTVLPYIIGLFKTRMAELGNYYELHTFPGRKHYLGEGNTTYSGYFDEEILDMTDGFLKKTGL